MNGSDTTASTWPDAESLAGPDAASLYREVAPAEPHPFVRCWWEQSVDERVDGYVQRVLPDACADVIVSADGSAVVVGPATEPVLPRLRGGERLRGLRIRTTAIGTVLGLPAYELRDLQVPLRELFPAAEAGRMADGVWHGRRWSPAVDGPPEDRRIEYAVRRLMRTGTRVADLAGEIDLSERQLRRLLLAATGLEPRTLRRVARFQRFLTLSDQACTRPVSDRACTRPVSDRACTRPESDRACTRPESDRARTRPDRARTPSGPVRPERSLAELAVSAGYADQAHLSREARVLAGLTPSALLAERHPSAAAAGRPGDTGHDFPA
ncbi:helix-turn-helix domain-containing protein [Actinoallomurus liliacearum]|uniref:Helix-turn-helix domain-containing protein n=1 Tax=Actinoallomurus liliacearum TaxID=1080073 RepID=A0ABP8TSV8_9ACTN